METIWQELFKGVVALLGAVLVLFFGSIAWYLRKLISNVDLISQKIAEFMEEHDQTKKTVEALEKETVKTRDSFNRLKNKYHEEVRYDADSGVFMVFREKMREIEEKHESLASIVAKMSNNDAISARKDGGA